MPGLYTPGWGFGTIVLLDLDGPDRNVCSGHLLPLSASRAWMASWICLARRSCLRIAWRRWMRYSASFGSGWSSRLPRRIRASESLARRFASSGDSGVPKTWANEAGAVCDELFFRCDVAVVVDLAESPDFEVLRRLADGTGVYSVADLG